MHFAVGLALALSAAINTANTQQVLPTPQIMPAAETVEGYVRTYFADTPIMSDIARCESHFRQFDKNGSVHRGKVNNKDVGVMQINEYYHSETAEKLGLDIYTIEGNVTYARYLYGKEGTRPWTSSKPCWGKSENLARK
jgi:hypothetical protein